MPTILKFLQKPEVVRFTNFILFWRFKRLFSHWRDLHTIRWHMNTAYTVGTVELARGLGMEFAK
jgi:hypothetical protein